MGPLYLEILEKFETERKRETEKPSIKFQLISTNQLTNC